MIRPRTILFSLALLVVVPILGGMGVAAWVLWDLPPTQGERIRGPHQLKGIQSGGAYVWVIPAGNGVVLVDAGLDLAASQVLSEVGNRTIHAILLTHGHGEQIAGLAALTGAPVYVGAGDRGLIEGTEAPGGWLARWFDLLIDRPDPPEDLRDIADGQVLQLGDASIRAVAMPGHTAGSTAWLWEDVLFTGGALLASNPPRLMPAALSNDDALAEASLEGLLPLDFDWIADGHTGAVAGGRDGLYRMLGQTEAPAEITVRTPSGEVSVGPDVERSGLYVQAPVVGPDGLAPALLVLDNGEEWVLSVDRADATMHLNGRQVVARGRIDPALDGSTASPSVTLRQPTIEAVDATGDGSLPRIADRASLEAAVHQWGMIEGTIVDLEPLARGSLYGEGHVRLSDDTVVPLAAPMASRDAAQWLARIRSEADGFVAIASLDQHLATCHLTDSCG